MLKIFNDDEFIVIAENQQEAELLVKEFFKKQGMDYSTGRMRRDTVGEFKWFYFFEESTIQKHSEKKILGNKHWS